MFIFSDQFFKQITKFILFILIVTVFTLWLYLLHLYAPSLNLEGNTKGEIKFPSNLQELQIVAATLQAYSVNHWWYVLLIFSSAYIYKQSFCVPGSIFLNILAGALYGLIGGIFLACLYTAIGATICYCLSCTFAKDIAFNLFSKKFLNFQEKIHQNRDDLFYFMLFIRLVPVAPGWVINVVAPLVEVPLLTFFVTTFLGLIPYNFVGVSAGGMLSSLKSINDIFTWKVLLNISAIGMFAVGPAYLLKKKSQNEKVNLRNKIGL